MTPTNDSVALAERKRRAPTLAYGCRIGRCGTCWADESECACPCHPWVVEMPQEAIRTLIVDALMERGCTRDRANDLADEALAKHVFPGAVLDAYDDGTWPIVDMGVVAPCPNCDGGHVHRLLSPDEDADGYFQPDVSFECCKGDWVGHEPPPSSTE